MQFRHVIWCTLDSTFIYARAMVDKNARCFMQWHYNLHYLENGYFSNGLNWSSTLVVLQALSNKLKRVLAILLSPSLLWNFLINLEIVFHWFSKVFRYFWWILKFWLIKTQKIKSSLGAHKEHFSSSAWALNSQ